MSPLRLITLFIVTQVLDYGLSQEKGHLQILPFGSVKSFPTNKGSLITCQAMGQPQALFTEMKWINNIGEEVKTDDKYEVRSEPGKISLRFQNPTTEDSGDYTCKAKFQGVDEPPVKVTVSFYKDLSWSDCPEHQNLIVGQEGIIKCRVTAVPKATVEWRKNGELLSKNSRYLYEPDNAAIKVNGEVNPEDGGQYTISASIELVGSYDQRVIHVSVYTKPVFEPSNDTYEVIDGQEAQIFCRANGEPVPHYSWLDRDKKNLSNEVGYLVNQETGALTIIKVEEKHRGNFTCIAKNAAGEIQKPVQLSVLVKPTVVFNNVSGIETVPFDLECRARGNPLPRISLRKDGEQNTLLSDSRRTVTNKTVDGENVLQLTINGLAREDSGLYYCEAENKAAKEVRAAYVSVEYKPDLSKSQKIVKTWETHPVNLTCLVDAFPPAAISWTYRGQPIDLSGKIYKVINETNGISRLLVTPTTVMDQIYGDYQCKADNIRGSGFVTINLEKATAPNPPSFADVKFEENPTSIKVVLLVPLEDNGKPIESYTVQYRNRDEYGDQMRTEEFGDPKAKEFEIRNLKPNSQYEIRIAAKNAVGQGEFSDSFLRKTAPETAPGRPEVIYGAQKDGSPTDYVIGTYSDKYRVKWSPAVDNGKPIKSYEVKVCEIPAHRLGSSEACTDGETYNASPKENQMEYLVPNLKRSSYYRIEVRAVNDVGSSEPSFLIVRTADYTVTSPGDDDEDEKSRGVSKSSSSLITTLLIVFFILLLILIIMDVIFYLRCQVGALYFLRSHFCTAASMDADSKLKGDDVTASRGDTVLNEELTPMMINGANGGKTDHNDEKPPVIPRDSAV